MWLVIAGLAFVLAWSIKDATDNALGALLFMGWTLLGLNAVVRGYLLGSSRSSVRR
ncbi:hypothetical protein [Nocardioides lijunqiniae]|uniref:hypothetical protein n=1 Tax=Nocardioides lijunqiniae TaxID=2760832 RepID=UPI001877B67D|nr:hypothetical protein [Nocardioides lijunqiniae]